MLDKTPVPLVYAPNVAEMPLYCWQHNTTHSFTAGEVEQVVYTLTAMLFDAEQRDADARYAAYDPKLLLCPITVLRLAEDSECYLEQVEQGVERRKAAG